MAAKDPRTVFIRGVSFDADEKDLETAFSDVGPVKQCFLVRVKGQPKHRGFGFVQYALQEDAERAVEELSGESLKGRKLQVEVADKRAPLEERKKKRKLDQDAAGGEGGEAAPAAAPAPEPRGKPGKPAAAATPAADGSEAAQEPTAAAAPAAAPAAKRQRAERAASKPGADGSKASAEKHKLLRAVAVGNLTPASVAQVIALARKAGPVEEVMNPAPQEVVRQAKLEADGCSGNVIIVVYKTVKDAMTAVSKLHNQTLTVRPPQQQQAGRGKKGKKGKKHKGKGGEGDDSDADEEAAAAAAAGAEEGAEEGTGAARITLWAREVKGEGAHVKQWRIILRNLPFKVTEGALVKALEPVGFVWELKLPRGPDGRIKGFAFASFTCRAHAEKAIAALNGKELMGRMVVVDWAVSKTQYQAAAKAAGGAAAAASGEGAEAGDRGSEDPDRPDSGSEGLEDEEDEDGSEGEDESAGEDEESAGEDEDEDEEEDEDDDEEEIGLSSDEDGEILDDDDDDDDEEDDEDDDEDGDEEEDEEEGAQEEEGQEEVNEEDKEAARERGILSSALQAVLNKEEKQQREGEQPQQAGKDAAAKQKQPQQQPLKKPDWQGTEVYDPDTAAGDAKGRSRPAGPSSGPPASSSIETTVFVRGLPLDVTAPQLQARLELFGPVKSCRVVMDKTSGKPKGTAFVEFRAGEAAGKAAEACARGRRHEGPGITVAGRQLEVDLALSGEGARSLATQRQDTKTTSRDRRNLYLAKEGTIAEGSPAWRGMSGHDQAKRKRAAEEKNTKLKSPNFIVSRTRLSVRNIPPGCTEAQLRRLFADAVRQRATKERPQVVQAKILREEGKYDESGARKSKGLGFVEFASHDHALAALRQLNNNPGTPWGRERRPVVEFAIDNVKVLKKIEHFKERSVINDAKQQQDKQDKQDKQQQDRKDRQHSAQAAAADGGEGGEEGGKAAKKGKKRERAAVETEAAEGKEAEAAGEEQAGGRKGRDKGKREKREKGGDKGGKEKREKSGQEGGEEGGLSKRQRQRLKQKERVERKKQLLKEGGMQALVAEVEANKQQRRQGGGAAVQNGSAKPQGKPQRQQPQQKQEQRQQQQGQRKRRVEEDEIDRIAKQGLAEDGGANKRRRRNTLREEGEGRVDKHDRLVEQYKAKLSGEGPKQKSNSKSSRADAKRGPKGGKGQGQQQKGGAGAGAAKGGKAAGGAAGVAALVAGAAAGGLRRWFD